MRYIESGVDRIVQISSDPGACYVEKGLVRRNVFKRRICQGWSNCGDEGIP